MGSPNHCATRSGQKQDVAHFTKSAHPPDDSLIRLRGDCEDNTTLICYRYAALDLRIAIYAIDSPHSESHCTALVEPPVNPIEHACDLLLLYYYNQRGFYPESISIDLTEVREILVVPTSP